jgi:hypothetical protein
MSEIRMMISVSYTETIDVLIRSFVMLEAPATSALAPKQKTVDFTSGEPMDAPVAVRPRSSTTRFFPARYRRGLEARPPKR